MIDGSGKSAFDPVEDRSARQFVFVDKRDCWAFAATGEPPRPRQHDSSMIYSEEVCAYFKEQRDAAAAARGLSKGVLAEVTTVNSLEGKDLLEEAAVTRDAAQRSRPLTPKMSEFSLTVLSPKGDSEHHTKGAKQEEENEGRAQHFFSSETISDPRGEPKGDESKREAERKEEIRGDKPEKVSKGEEAKDEEASFSCLKTAAIICCRIFSKCIPRKEEKKDRYSVKG